MLLLCAMCLIALTTAQESTESVRRLQINNGQASRGGNDKKPKKAGNPGGRRLI